MLHARHDAKVIPGGGVLQGKFVLLRHKMLKTKPPVLLQAQNLKMCAVQVEAPFPPIVHGTYSVFYFPSDKCTDSAFGWACAMLCVVEFLNEHGGALGFNLSPVICLCILADYVSHFEFEEICYLYC